MTLQETDEMTDQQIAEKANQIFHNKYPEYSKKYKTRGKKKAYRDWLFHISYLKGAIDAAEPNLFVDYVIWCKKFFNSINFPEKYLLASFEILAEIYKKIDSDFGKKAHSFITKALQKFPSLPHESNSFVEGDSHLGVLAQRYLNSLLRKDLSTASKLINDAVDEGVSIKDIYLYVFQPAQYEVGRLWQNNTINVATEHYCTAATQNIISRLYPHIFSGQTSDKKIIATSVSGELHELGIRMVADFFEMEGWDTYYLGANTPHSSLISMINEVKPDIIAISATISYHISEVVELIKKIQKKADYHDYKIIVGGYPFNKNKHLWETVGADSFATDANQAVKEANKLLKAE